MMEIGDCFEKHYEIGDTYGEIYIFKLIEFVEDNGARFNVYYDGRLVGRSLENLNTVKKMRKLSELEKGLM